MPVADLSCMENSLDSGCPATGQAVQCLTSLAGIEAMERQWRGLDGRSTADLVWFQSYEWCHRWLQHHTDDGTRPVVLMLLENGEATAILPLMRQSNRLGIRTLKILGEPHTQYANVLTVDGKLSDAQAKALSQALDSLQDVDLLSFSLVPEGSALAQLLPELATEAVVDNSTSHLDLRQYPSIEAYEGKLGKKSARNLRRSANQLSALGPLSLAVSRPGDAAFKEHVQRCVAMKKFWLQATGRISSGLDGGEHGGFLSSLHGSDMGPVAFVLKAGSRPLAIELGFLQRGHYYAYMGAFDWKLRHLSPGKLQMHMTLGWLIENGVHTLDLLGHPAEYKERFSSHNIALKSGVREYTLLGRSFGALWMRNARPQLKWLFSKLPGSFRVSMNVMRKLEYNFIA